jgi:hypothetical protein
MGIESVCHSTKACNQKGIALIVCFNWSHMESALGRVLYTGPLAYDVLPEEQFIDGPVMGLSRRPNHQIPCILPC